MVPISVDSLSALKWPAEKAETRLILQRLIEKNMITITKNGTLLDNLYIREGERGDNNDRRGEEGEKWHKYLGKQLLRYLYSREEGKIEERGITKVLATNAWWWLLKGDMEGRMNRTIRRLIRKGSVFRTAGRKEWGGRKERVYLSVKSRQGMGKTKKDREGREIEERESEKRKRKEDSEKEEGEGGEREVDHQWRIIIGRRIVSNRRWEEERRGEEKKERSERQGKEKEDHLTKKVRKGIRGWSGRVIGVDRKGRRTVRWKRLEGVEGRGIRNRGRMRVIEAINRKQWIERWNNGWIGEERKGEIGKVIVSGEVKEKKKGNWIREWSESWAKNNVDKFWEDEGREEGMAWLSIKDEKRRRGEEEGKGREEINTEAIHVISQLCWKIENDTREDPWRVGDLVMECSHIRETEVREGIRFLVRTGRWTTIWDFQVEMLRQVRKEKRRMKGRIKRREGETWSEQVERLVRKLGRERAKKRRKEGWRKKDEEDRRGNKEMERWEEDLEENTKVVTSWVYMWSLGMEEAGESSESDTM